MKDKEDFFMRVYEVVRKVPPGRVTTYGAVARYLGSPQSSRVVGYAMNASHNVIPMVPAHRVVNRSGCLTGKHHFPTPTAMQEMLEREGLIVIDDKIKDFEKIFWDPSSELSS